MKAAAVRGIAQSPRSSIEKTFQWTDDIFDLKEGVGNGYLDFDDGQTFRGRIKDGEYQIGEFILRNQMERPSFSHYKGKGFMNLHFSGGNTYKGEVKDGKRNGWGEQKTDYLMYDGEWKDDIFQGWGNLQLNFTGHSFKDGMPQHVFGLGEVCIKYLELLNKGISKRRIPEIRKKYDREDLNGAYHGSGELTITHTGKFHKGVPLDIPLNLD